MLARCSVGGQNVLNGMLFHGECARRTMRALCTGWWWPWMANGDRGAVLCSCAGVHVHCPADRPWPWCAWLAPCALTVNEGNA